MSEEVYAADALLEENAELRQALFVAHKLIGRLDFFLETYAAQPDRIQRQMSAKLRLEIKEASAPHAR